MVTLIILTAVVICLLALLIAILYMRNEEVQVTDKATDLADILPIQTITQDAIINGNGDITVGYRMLLLKCSHFRKKKLNISMRDLKLS